MAFEQAAPPQTRPSVGVRAFLIADVRGYTRFTQEHGDAAATRLALRFAEVVHEEVARTQGELLGLRGDEAAVAFGSVREALRTALALQDRFARARTADPALPLRVGMGLDAGEAVAVTDGYRGMALNVAARLCAAAPAGTILITESLAHLAGAVEEVAYLDHGRLTLKGLAAPVHVLELLPAHFVALVAAPDDGAHGERLREDLRAQGVALWAVPPSSDSEDGEQGVRSGVRASHAVLLLGTPRVLHARPVKAVLGIAHLYQRPIIAVWVAGDDGEAEQVAVEAIDLRGERYGPGLAHLVAALARAEPPIAPLLPALLQDAPPRNPYKGLRAFRGADAGDFFGRDGLIGELVAAVRAYTQPGMARFLAVVGPSGSGKSSVVLAGLLPRLHGGAVLGSAEWVYLDPLVPGTHPLEALAAILNNALPGSSLTALHTDLDTSERALHALARRLVPDSQGRAVLVVDQAEELFTLTDDDDERRQFIDLLVTAVCEPRGPLLVVLTLRADFYDRPMSYIQLGRLVDAQSRAVLPLEPAELRAAIEGPAALPDVGLRFEGDLVGDLLYEVRDRVGALPLLQFTLDQLYERRDGHLLTEATYRELGGVRGALARHAEATFMGLPDEGYRALARALFLRLIEPGTSAQEATRRRAPLAELELAEAVQTSRMRTVVETFIAGRLVTAQESGGTTTLEVSHEALIREWGRLGDWVHATREDVRVQGRISADAAEWARHGRPADSLYRGTVLAEAQGWAERNTPSALETAFLGAAAAEGQRQAVAEQERQARELAVARQAAMANRRAATRLRTLVGVLAAFLVAAGGLTAFAINNAEQARLSAAQARRSAAQAGTYAQLEKAARARAIAERDRALSRQLAAQAVTRLDSQFDLALLLGLEGYRIARTAEARDSLMRALQTAPPNLIALLSGQTPVDSVAFSPDGRLLVSGNGAGTIRFWNVARRRAIGPPLPDSIDQVDAVAFSPNGAILAVGSVDGTLRLWDVRLRRRLGAPLPPALRVISTVCFSPDGRTLAVGGYDNTYRKTIELVDVASRRPRPISTIQRGSDPYDEVSALGWSPDGTMLASGSTDGSIDLWDMRDGLLVAPGTRRAGVLLGHQGGVYSLAFSPDGKMLASAGEDYTIRLWDVVRQRPIGHPLRGHTDWVESVAFNRRSSLLASGSLDGTVRLWDVRQRRPSGASLVSHMGAVRSVQFSSDGTMLAAGSSAGAAGSIALWDVRHQRGLSATYAKDVGGVMGVVVSPDGKTLVSGSLTLWPGATTNFSMLRFWDMATGVLRRAIPLTSVLSDLAFSPKGRLLAVGGYAVEGPPPFRGVVQLWDASAPRLLSQRLVPDPSNGSTNVANVAYSPNGSLVATVTNGTTLGAKDSVLQLWSVTRQRHVRLDPVGVPLRVCSAITGIAFSPDGRVLACSSASGALRLWDVAHRRPIGPVFHVSRSLGGIAFSPSGTMLALADGNDTVHLWDVRRYRPIGAPLIGHTGQVGEVAFSPDGTLLATSSADHTVRLWDVASQQPLGAPLTGSTHAMTSVAFSPAGTTLVAGAGDGTIDLWNVDLATWPSRACHIANRNLTRAEWQQYVPNLPYHKTCPGLP